MFEYISPDGTALPENEVIKLAKDSFTDIETYIKKNKLTIRSKQKKKPEVKQEVAKPVAKKVVKPTQSEIEKTWGKQPKTDMLGVEKLKDSKPITDPNIIAENKRKKLNEYSNQIKLGVQEFRANRELTEDDHNVINEEFNAYANPGKKRTVIPGGAGASPKIEFVPITPFKKEIEDIKTDNILKGIQMSDADVLYQAKQVKMRELVNTVKSAKDRDYMNSISYLGKSDKQKGIESYLSTEQDYFKTKKQNALSLNARLQLSNNQNVKEYNTTLKELEATDTKKINTQEGFDLYNAKVNRLGDLNSQMNEDQHLLDKNNQEFAFSNKRLGSASQELDAAKRHYGLENPVLRLGYTLGEFGMGSVLAFNATVGDLITVIPRAIGDAITGEEFSWMSDSTKNMASNLSNMQKSQEAWFEKDTTDSPINLAKHAGNLLISQVPNIALAYFTGGAAPIAEEAAIAAAKEIAAKELTTALPETIIQNSLKSAAVKAASVAGESTVADALLWTVDKLKVNTATELAMFAPSMGQKVSEELATNELPALEGGTNYNTGQILLSSALWGWAETIGEKAQIKMVGGWGRTIKAAVEETPDLIKTIAKEQVKNIVKKGGGIIHQQFDEQVSEHFTNLMQNTIDRNLLGKDVGYLDNTGQTFKDTALLTGLMTTAPHIAGAAIKPFFIPEEQKQVKAIANKLMPLLTELGNAKSAAEKKIIQNTIKELTAESNDLHKNVISRIGNMSVGTWNDIVKSSKELAKIRNQAKLVYDGESPNKGILLKNLQTKYNSIDRATQSKLAEANGLNNFEYFKNMLPEDKRKVVESISEINRLKALNTSDGIANEQNKAKIKKLTEDYTSILINRSNTNLNNLVENLQKTHKVFGSITSSIENNMPAVIKKYTEIKNERFIKDSEGKSDKAVKKLKLILNKELAEINTGGSSNALNVSMPIYDNDGNQLKDSRGRLISDEIVLINKASTSEQGILAATKASHEMLHVVFKKAFGINQNAFVPMANALLDHIKTTNPKMFAHIKDNIEGAYGDYSEGVKAEEILAYVSELIQSGNLKYNESFFKNIGLMLTNAFNTVFGIPALNKVKGVNLNSGKDVYDFIGGYAKGFEKGKISLGTKVALKGGVSGKLLDGSTLEGKTGISYSKVKDLKQELVDLEAEYDDGLGDMEEEAYKNQKSNIETKLRIEIKKEAEGTPKVEKPKKEVSEESTVKEIIKENKGKISSDKVQEIYDKKGVEGALEIMKLFKPITARIVDKRRDAPGFSEPDLTYEIENGKGGILDLIMKYDPSEGVPLAAYINKYLPVRAITASRRVLDKEFTSDVSEEVNVAATETADQNMTERVAEKPKYKDAIESNILEPSILETAVNKIISITRLLKNRIDAPITLNRTVTPLIAEIRDEIGKQLDIDIKTMLGGKKDGVLRKQLLKAKRYILENMTTTWLMGKDGQGGIPQAIQKRIDGKWVSFPDWIGQKIDREAMSTDLAGRTSGAELVRRLPNVFNNISDEIFLAQIIGPDGNPIRGRKESVSKAMAEEIAFDITKRDLQEEGPIYDALKANQERLGYEIANNFAVEFTKQADRGNIKHSKAVKALTDLSFDSKSKLIGENRDSFINFMKDIKDVQYVDRAFDVHYGKIKFSDDDKNIIIEAVKDLYSLYETKATTKYVSKFTPKNQENFNSYANRVVFNSLSKDQSLALTLGISVNELGNIENGKDQILNFLSTAKEELGGDNKAAATLIRLFSRSLAYGQKQSLFGLQEEIYNSFLKPLNITENDFAVAKVGRGKTITYAGEKVNRIIQAQDTSAPDIVNAIKTGKISDEDYKIRKENSANAIADTVDILKLLKVLYNKGKLSNLQLGFIFKGLGGSMSSTLKVASQVRFVSDNKGHSLNPKDWVYEHTPPTSYISRIALGIVTGSNDLTIKDFKEKVLENSYVAIIPKSVDKVINTLYKSTMPFYYQIGDNPLVRYYNPGFLGAAIPAVYDFETKKQIGVGFKEGAFQSEAARIANEAVTSSLKPSKTPKGISVFDFDDTVGLTEGSVLYTMPDGSKGKLNAEEFAKEGSSYLEQGAVFDFSEFSKVVGGKPGPMVEKMKKMIGKFGSENFFILTARPANAAGPIHEFLSSIGIDIPLENITGLGNSTAQAKADWMTGKAAEGYNDFYFADDAPQNVDAVKKALNIPGVDSKVQRAILKFSLTTKVNLDWETKFGVTAADFKVGENNYSINIASTRAYGLGEDPLFAQAFQNIADDLKLPADYLTFNSNVKWVTFSEKTKGFGILNTGNAFEVLGIVTNALSDYANENNLDGIAFDAKEPSRIKLYKTLASTIGSKLGWVYNTGNLKSESGGELFVLTPAKSGALKNQPKPVKDVLNVVDVKSPRQQAKVKFSKTISTDFNKILEENVGVKANEKFSDVVAKRKGAGIGKYRFFVPPSAADLELLTYDFLGYGKKGEEQQKFFNKALFEPYANGIALIDAAKQSIKNDYKALLKAFPEVSKELGKLTPDGNFTYDQALRVSMWTSMGEEVPGLLKEDSRKLNDFVNQDPQLSAFKAGLIATGRQGTGWVTPTEYWDSETIVSDLHNITEKLGRKKYLAEFVENSEEMFSKDNLNKIETIYGSNFRDALEDSIYSMVNGTNREGGPGRINSAWLNWINNSTGAIMFFNTRSAVLQTVGAINYLNWRDNNPLNAAKAFADQPQYWADFVYIWNSDKMKERRGGLKEDVSAAEIANAAQGSKNRANAVISYLLKLGYTPTQIGDSFAIACGGAPFYRNRINYNLKQGMSQEDAETNAWKEFVKVTDQTQQSGDPRDVSQQQRSTAGRLVLAFQNTSMQQARLVKKAGLDLINNRGDAKTNISKIVYYTMVQNIIFGGLQSALFATVFSDDDDEEKKKKKQTAKDKWLDIGNGIVDTILRGSGISGAVVATLKNVYLKYHDEHEKGFKADYAKVLIEAANIAPAVGSKFQKGYGAMRTAEFEKDVIAKRGWSVTQNGRINLSPTYSVLGQGVEATTNLPMNRFVNKVNNLSEAMDSRNKSWQRIALAIGYTPYAIGAKDEEGDIIKAEAKAQRKIEGKEKSAETRRKKKEDFKNLPESEKIKIRKQKLKERRAKILAKRNIYK